jgi:hypothetical protein
MITRVRTLPTYKKHPKETEITIHDKGLMQAKSLAHKKLEGFENFNIIPHHQDVFIHFKPKSEDVKFKPDLKPAKVIIENYVEFFMARYPPQHDRDRVERGLYVEKAFDLLLQDIGVAKDYAEPIRDWRQLKPCEFYVPMLGKLEIKSTITYKGILKFCVNIYNWERESPDYAVVLQILDSKRDWIKLLGAMPAEKVESYKVIETQEPFWAIPCKDLTIKPLKLCQELVKVKKKLAHLPRLKL